MHEAPMKQLYTLCLALLLSLQYPVIAQNMLVTSSNCIGARSLGMGSAFAAVASDGTAFLFNPAGITLSSDYLLSGCYASKHGAIGQPLGNVAWGGINVPMNQWSASANWIRFQSADQQLNPDLSSISSITQREKTIRQPTNQSFTTQSEDAFSVTVARQNVLKIDWGWNQYVLPIEIPVGLTLRHSRALNAGRLSTGWSLDAGVMMSINCRDMFFSDEYPYICFGWTLKNIGSTVMTSQSGHTDLYPFSSTIAFAVIQPLESLESEATLDYDHDTRDASSSRIGLEWKYRKFYFARIGLMGSNLCMGLGVDVRFFIIDYAYQFRSENNLGDTHQIQLAFRLQRLFL